MGMDTKYIEGTEKGGLVEVRKRAGQTHFTLSRDSRIIPILNPVTAMNIGPGAWRKGFKCHTGLVFKVRQEYTSRAAVRVQNKIPLKKYLGEIFKFVYIKILHIL
jgi:hypothetical protein